MKFFMLLMGLAGFVLGGSLDLVTTYNWARNPSYGSGNLYKAS